MFPEGLKLFAELLMVAGLLLVLVLLGALILVVVRLGQRQTDQKVIQMEMMRMMNELLKTERTTTNYNYNTTRIYNYHNNTTIRQDPGASSVCLIEFMATNLPEQPISNEYWRECAATINQQLAYLVQVILV
jgi:hypothetical protein